jgi:LysM repeat protein
MQLKRSILVISFLIGCMPLLKAQKLSTQQYIAKYKDVAINEMQRSGVPASIKLAQGILETQSGNGWLVLNSNNHFGIKCKNNWAGESVKYDDDAAQECFRKYPSANDSYKDHSDFLRNNPRYAFLFQFQEEDYKSWAYGLKQAGYATSSTYPQQLIKIIEDNNLQQYTLEGEGVAKAGTANAKTGDEVIASLPSKNTPASPVATPTNKSTGITLANAPKGIFQINDRKVIVVPAGTALIQVANQRDIKLRNLVHYNDLENDNPKSKDMFVFLQKKGKSGKNDYHTVAPGETMYDIAQAEGIQLRWLRRRNKMKEGQEPEIGERLALDGYAKGAPLLAKNPPPEDPTIGDLNPGQIVENVRTEMERQQEIAQQQAAQQAPAKESPAQNNLPAGMVEDLKKIGEVKPTGNSTAQHTTNNTSAGPAEEQPVPAQPAAPVQQTPTPVQPAPPVQQTPATQPVPAPPTPATVAKNETIREGNSLFHDVQTKETLYSIAKRYNVSVEQLQQWNHLEAFDIKIGQRLLVGKI